VFEEFSFIPEEVFFQVILPLMQVGDTVLLGISTVVKNDNYFMQQFDLKKPDGRPLFNWHYCHYVCDYHLAIKQPEECMCRLDELPPWKSVARITQSRQIYSFHDNMDLFSQEILGFIPKDKNVVFKKEILDTFQAQSFVSQGPTLDYTLYISVDPTGGAHDNMGICSFYFTHDRSQIVVSQIWIFVIIASKHCFPYNIWI